MSDPDDSIKVFLREINPLSAELSGTKNFVPNFIPNLKLLFLLRSVPKFQKKAIPECSYSTTIAKGVSRSKPTISGGGKQNFIGLSSGAHRNRQRGATGGLGAKLGD